MTVCSVLSTAVQAQGSFARPTHKQTHVFRPSLEGDKLAISTFCLDLENNLLVCSGGNVKPTGVLSALTSMLGSSEQPGRVTRFSPEFEHVASCELDFIPTAINVAPDGTIFVAGNGHVAKLSDELKLLKSVEYPHIENLKEHKKKRLKEIQAELEAQAQAAADYKKSAAAKIKELEVIPESERSAAQRAQLSAAKQLLEVHSGLLSNAESVMESTGMTAAMMLNMESSMPSIAVTDRDVFLACTSSLRYDIWRFDHEFGQPTKVVSKVSGCCGQLDIQAVADELLLSLIHI